MKSRNSRNFSGSQLHTDSVSDKKNRAQIGIIGGSGFYDLASSLEELKVETPYGPPSDKVAVGEICGKTVAFLPRHGKGHNIPPHLVNYRANIWALHSLGVKGILTSNAVGSLQKEYQPGDFVIIDQFIDRTKGRIDTFYDGPMVTHISTAFPYCPQLRKLAIKQAKKIRLPVHENGTVVVIQGPRFSTAAESLWFTKMGWQAVNMTQYPEVALAREKEMCFCSVGVITDYDSGLASEGKVKPVSVDKIAQIFKKNMGNVKKLMREIIKNWPETKTCGCQEALCNARFKFMKEDFLSLIVPAYKQERTIVKDLKNIESVLKTMNCAYEIICVVDGRVDKTYEKARAIKSKKVKILVYGENKGKGYAVRYGMSRAKGNMIAFIDAGMDINARGIPLLLEHMRWYGSDIIVGSIRHSASKVIGYPLKRKIYSFGYHWLTRILFGLRITDSQRGIKIFKREVLEKVLQRLLVKRFAFDIEMLAVANSLGFKKIHDGPVEMDARKFKFSSIKTETVFAMLVDTLGIFYRLKILKYYNGQNRKKWVCDKDLQIKPAYYGKRN